MVNEFFNIRKREKMHKIDADRGEQDKIKRTVPKYGDFYFTQLDNGMRYFMRFL